jgi:hypothetical protein
MLRFAWLKPPSGVHGRVVPLLRAGFRHLTCLAQTLWVMETVLSKTVAMSHP